MYTLLIIHTINDSYLPYPSTLTHSCGETNVLNSSFPLPSSFPHHINSYTSQFISRLMFQTVPFLFPHPFLIISLLMPSHSSFRLSLLYSHTPPPFLLDFLPYSINILYYWCMQPQISPLSFSTFSFLDEMEIPLCSMPIFFHTFKGL